MESSTTNSPELNDLTHAVIGAAIEVHRELGPGLLESAYEACLAHELASSGLKLERQVALPVIYKGERVDCGFRLDLLIEDRLIVEIKAKDKIHPVDEAQILSYLRLTNNQLGLLINFHVTLLKNGIKRIANDLRE